MPIITGGAALLTGKVLLALWSTGENVCFYLAIPKKIIKFFFGCHLERILFSDVLIEKIFNFIFKNCN